MIKGKACIRWHKALYPGGYGRRWYKGKGELAHRVAWALKFNKGILPTLLVLHTCDNRACVETSHLFLGTQKDNMQDMFIKGRQHCFAGEKNPNVKLTSADIPVIRLLFGTITQREIAKRFGVTECVISAIKLNRAWTHV